MPAEVMVSPSSSPEAESPEIGSPEIGSPETDVRAFLVRVDLVAGRLELAGHLGRGTVHLFHDAISTLLVTDLTAWVVDASGLTACDRVGVHAIGAAYRRALRSDRRLTLTGSPPSLRRDLTRVRLDRHVLAGSDATTTVSRAVSA